MDATETVKLTAPDGAAEDRFGWSVSISGSDVIVGAVFDDDKGSDSGSAYMFRKDCPDWLTADVNGDCLVDFVDFAILARQWLQYGY